MRDYICKWLDNPTGTPVSELSTPVIADMLDYIDRGEPINLDDCSSREACHDRLVLELEIRTWGLKCH